MLLQTRARVLRAGAGPPVRRVRAGGRGFLRAWFQAAVLKLSSLSSSVLARVSERRRVSSPGRLRVSSPFLRRPVSAW